MATNAPKQSEQGEHMSVEAMKQMVEAIDADLKLFNIPATAKMLEALNAGRQAIAEAEKQEPVGVVGMDVSRPHISYGGQYLGQKQDTKTAILFKDLEVGTNLYTHPSKREWVVLTDE